ncbi:MAG: DUF2474 family protein [Alphaproteobacteria bacterium]|nr:MAG: DUF2474 family protein [Alphaproteobacteria bacterium]
MTVRPSSPVSASSPRKAVKGLAWFVGIYAASIAALAVVTGLLKWLMKGF